MITSLKELKKVIELLLKEEIGRNFHTLHDEPITFDDFSDYSIEINGSDIYGFFLEIFYKGEKIFYKRKFNTYEDAHHASRMVVDKHRVNMMNTDAETKR